MKSIINPVTTLSIDGKKVTIVADVADLPFDQNLTTRTTHGHLNPDNELHPRHIQCSNVTVFLRSRYGAISIPNDTIAAIGAVVEPATTFPPYFKKHASGAITVISELPMTFQWEMSEDAFPKGPFPPPVAVWTPINGATEPEYDFVGIKTGQWTRLVATNAAGTTISKPSIFVSKQKMAA